MTTALQLRRGTTAQHSTFTGAQGEVTVDTDKKTAVVHDGVTPGGYPLAKASELGVFVRFDTGSQGLTAGQQSNVRANIGLSNVNNTADADKPVSNATASALALKLDKSGGTLTGPLILAGNAVDPLAAVTKQQLEAVAAEAATAAAAAAAASLPPSGKQFFTANGQFTVPEGVTRLLVTVIGGGGGGTGVRAVPIGTSTTNYYAVTASGGGGGCGKALIPVTPGQVIPVTVGGGGAGGVPSTNVRAYAGGAGGTSSFGTYVTCTGGASGGGQVNQTSIAHVECPARAAKGSFSASSEVLVAVDLGEDYMGVTPGPSYTQSVGLAGTGFGAGGGGVIRYGSQSTGGAGTQGCVLIEW